MDTTQPDVQTTPPRPDHREPATERAPAADGVSLGLLAVIAGTLGIMAAYGELFVDALAFLVVFAGLGVWAALRPAVGVRWAIAVLLLPFLGFNLVYAAGDLAHPESAAPFVPTLVVMGAGATTIVLAVLAARRRPAPGLRVWSIGLVVVVVAAAGSALAASQVSDDVAQPGDAVVVAEDFEFPTEVELSSDGGVLLQNEDRARHTFVVDSEVDAIELPAGTDVRAELDLEPGTYRFYCDIAGHEDMEGTLVVS